MRINAPKLRQLALAVLALAASSAQALDITFSVDDPFYRLGTNAIRGDHSFSETFQGALAVADAKVTATTPGVSIDAPDGYAAGVHGLRIISATAQIETESIKSLQFSGGFKIQTSAFLPNGRRNGATTGGSLEISSLKVDFANGLVLGSVKGDHGLGTLRNLALWQFDPGAGLPKARYTLNGAVELLGLDPARTGSLSITEAGFNAFAQGLGLTRHLGVPALRSIDDFGTIGVTAVPEPSEWALVITGLACVGAVMRRRQASAPHRSVAGDAMPRRPSGT